MERAEVYSDGVGFAKLFKVDHQCLNKLAAQSAAALIVACEGYPTNGGLPLDGRIGRVLAERLSDWDATDFADGLLSQALFLHALVVHAVDAEKRPWGMDETTAKLVAEALDSYEHWENDFGGILSTRVHLNARNERFLALWR